MEEHRTQVPRQAGVGAVRLEVLEVLGVGDDAVEVGAVGDVVRALLDQVGAEQAGAARRGALVHVEQGAEGRVRLVQELHALGVFVVAVQFVRLAGLGQVAVVVDVVVAVLAQRGHAHRPLVRQRHVDGAFDVGGAVRAVRQVVVALGLLQVRLFGLELDDAGRGVAAEQRALRAAQHFHAGQVEDREAFQDRVFLDDLVIDQRHRLRRECRKVRVAVAADVETRERAAVRRLHVQARRLAGQQTDVLAAGHEHVQLFTLDGGDGHRHFLDVLGTALRRHGHRLQLGRLRGLGERRAAGNGRQRQHGAMRSDHTLVHLGHLDH